MKLNNIFSKKIFLIISLSIFSLLINQYYGNRGVYPLDSFIIFDAGFNVISGQHPFKDYWSITGPLLDYFQSFFFLFNFYHDFYIYIVVIVIHTILELILRVHLLIHFRFFFGLKIQLIGSFSTG